MRIRNENNENNVGGKRRLSTVYLSFPLKFTVLPELISPDYSSHWSPHPRLRCSMALNGSTPKHTWHASLSSLTMHNGITPSYRLAYLLQLMYYLLWIGKCAWKCALMVNLNLNWLDYDFSCSRTLGSVGPNISHHGVLMTTDLHTTWPALRPLPYHVQLILVIVLITLTSVIRSALWHPTLVDPHSPSSLTTVTWTILYCWPVVDLLFICHINVTMHW